MKATFFLAAIFVSFAAAQAPGGAQCYDDFDCLLTPNTKCVKTGTGLEGIVGTCQPTGMVTSVSAGPSTPTGGAGGRMCFDDGDCLLEQGTKCDRPSGQWLGTCKKA